MGMAKRSYSKKGRKIEPAVLSMLFETTAGAGLQSKFIDLSQCASLLNRRFYRQGINWVVSDIKFMNLQPQTGAEVAIGKLPNTWVMSNAWEKGFRAWQKMNREAMQEAESVRPKFLDFKIYADGDHQAAGFGSNLLPRAFVTGTTAIPGEWVASKIHVPFGPASPGNTTELEIMATGSNYNGATTPVVSLIEGYAASRGLPEILDPNTPGDADDASGSTPENWMSALFNDGVDQNTEVLADLISENNLAPYPFENDGVSTDTQYPGGANQLSGLEMHDFELITTTTVGGTTRLRGGNFPCGLIKIGTNAFAAGSNIIIQVNLVPGGHRGYLCEPMTEM